MLKKLLGSFLAIVLAAVAVGATMAAFSDTESSTGNSIAAGTLDLSYDDGNATLEMHPSWGRDYTVFTQFGGAGLSPLNRVALTSDDGNRYQSQGDWDAAVPDAAAGKRIELKFPGMTADLVTINAAGLVLDWQHSGITNARVFVSGDNGANYYGPVNLVVPAANTDAVSNIDLKAAGLDTSGELNKLVVKFQAWGAAARTSFDVARVVVSYTGTSPLQPLVEFASLRPGESQSITLSVSNSGSLTGVAQIGFANLVGANVVYADGTVKSQPELDDEAASGPFVTEELAAADIDNPQTYMKVDLEFADAAGNFQPVIIAKSFAESADDKNAFYDVAELAGKLVNLGALPGNGASRAIKLTVTLDPNNETGNIFRRDKVTFNVVFGVVQQMP